MIKNVREVKIEYKLNFKIHWIIGIKSVISTSKIKKINLIRKKWILKGGRLLEIGSNPHSKGDIFSRSWNVFLDMKKFMNIKIIEIIINMNEYNIIIIIIYINWFKFFNWKLNVINYYTI